MAALKTITVRGFKSIRALEDLELRNLNVLIGANGAGKSNFISLFQMLAALMDGRLQLWVQEHDGPDALLFGTRKRTEQMDAEFSFGSNGYHLSLRPAGGRLIFAREDSLFYGDYVRESVHPYGSGHEEALLRDVQDDRFAPWVQRSIKGWRVYHFHDTSGRAPMRHAQPVRDNLRLKPDAGNIAPFLRMLFEDERNSYERIVETVRMIAPFFGDFVYREEPGERVELEWFQRNDPDTPFGPRQLSDGTLRFICLTTLLLQPTYLQPDTILIDEPELGLHPYALTILAGLLRQASERRQIIVSTQSVELINHFSPEDIVVVDRHDDASTFTRLNEEQLSQWLEDYALGEMWKMNVIGGRPTR
ncbi:MAG: AAA family ATPase [Thermomicrobiales bacterium]